MKILITENQLEKVINNYITKTMSSFEIYEKESSPGNLYWVNSNLIIKAKYKKKNGFFIGITIYKEVKNMFSLSHTETGKVFKKWIENLIGITEISVRFDLETPLNEFS